MDPENINTPSVRARNILVGITLVLFVAFVSAEFSGYRVIGVFDKDKPERTGEGAYGSQHK